MLEMTKAPKMSRAHFKYLAGLMAEVRPADSHADELRQWEHTVQAMAVALTWTNDNFDKGAFTAACGMA